MVISQKVISESASSHPYSVVAISILRYSVKNIGISDGVAQHLLSALDKTYIVYSLKILQCYFEAVSPCPFGTFFMAGGDKSAGLAVGWASLPLGGADKGEHNIKRQH